MKVQRDEFQLQDPAHKITRYYITDIQAEFRLDPVTAQFFDFKESGGNLIIECYGQAWSAWWHGMGGLTTEQFIQSVNRGYLVDNLNKERLTKRKEEYMTRIINVVLLAIAPPESS